MVYKFVFQDSKAKENYKCDVCEKTILKGQKYFIINSKKINSNDWIRIKIHISCLHNIFQNMIKLIKENEK